MGRCGPAAAQPDASLLMVTGGGAVWAVGVDGQGLHKLTDLPRPAAAPPVVAAGFSLPSAEAGQPGGSPPAVRVWLIQAPSAADRWWTAETYVGGPGAGFTDAGAYRLDGIEVGRRPIALAALPTPGADDEALAVLTDGAAGTLVHTYRLANADRRLTRADSFRVGQIGNTHRPRVGLAYAPLDVGSVLVAHRAGEAFGDVYDLPAGGDAPADRRAFYSLQMPVVAVTLLDGRVYGITETRGGTATLVSTPLPATDRGDQSRDIQAVALSLGDDTALAMIGTARWPAPPVEPE